MPPGGSRCPRCRDHVPGHSTEGWSPPAGRFQPARWSRQPSLCLYLDNLSALPPGLATPNSVKSFLTPSLLGPPWLLRHT